MHRDPQMLIFPYKQVSGENADHEWLRMTNASYCMIYYEKFRNVMQQTEKETLSSAHNGWQQH